ncbi:hypothetical protein ACFW6V_04725 [Streptomyces sp. NPDC058734]|uniref:hypothetical protein n=1 Tax=Streptomyces sp. NPDC058734 TaxID=3346615 RepID=UPI0036971817
MNMNMRKRAAVLLASAATVAGSLLATAAPAQAYGTLDVRHARVDTDNCARLSGTLAVTPSANGCYLYDSVDNTYFEKDADAVAAKAELRDGGKLVSKVEFHPNGEKLWIYDTANDGDTVYVRVWTARTGWSPVYYAIGTDKVVDIHTVDFDFNEGEQVRIDIYDNSDATDWITSLWAVA